MTASPHNLHVQLDSSSIWAEVTGDPSALDHFEDKLFGLVRQELSGPSNMVVSPMIRKGDGHLRVLAGLLPMAEPDVQYPQVWDGDVGDLSAAISLLADLGWRRYQLDAIRSAIAAPLGRGYLDIGTGGGKTHIAAGIAYAGTGRWLYVTHGRSQVRQAAAAFEELRRHIGISIICRTWGKVEAQYLDSDMAGIIVDECHQCPAPSRARVLAQFRGGWRIGLSGTPLDRTDAKNALVVGLLGPLLHQVTVRELTARGSLTPGKVVIVSI